MKYLTLLFLFFSTTCFAQSDSVNVRIKTVEKKSGYKLDSVWAIFTTTSKKDSIFVYSDTAGWINIPLKKNRYRVFFGKTVNYAHCFHSERFSNYQKELQIQSDTIFTVVLEKIIRENYIRLENVFFDYKKTLIRPDAAAELRKIAIVLNRCKVMKLEVSTYSDCRELKKFNNKLNELRSKNILTFLIERGVTQDQLTFVNKAILYNTRCDCSHTCNEIEHQENRLASFKILNY